MPAFLLLFIYFFHPVNSGNCGRFPETDFRKSGSPVFHRVYANHAFGYRVRLPYHVTAYGEPPPQPAHGVGIVLSWERRSYLYLAGMGNTMLFANTSAAADSDEQKVRKESTIVRRVFRRWTRLGTHRALRMQVTHTCGAETFVTDEILLLKRNILYTISLTSPKTRYKTDQRVLDAIARSFQLIALQ